MRFFVHFLLLILAFSYPTLYLNGDGDIEELWGQQ